MRDGRHKHRKSKYGARGDSDETLDVANELIAAVGERGEGHGGWMRCGNGGWPEMRGRDGDGGGNGRGEEEEDKYMRTRCLEVK